MYDIIGDVHGQADQLKVLLSQMGYNSSGQVYSHPERKAVFVGDFINRGFQIRETIRMIRAMAENGHAYVILGNHEINAIYYSLLDKQGKRLSKRWSRLRLDLNPTLSEFASNMDEWNSHIKWMRTLPMFLEFEKIRVVHACWQDENIRLLKEQLTEPKLKKSFLRSIGKNNSEVARAFWETCKGIDFQLPKDLLVFDRDGRPHRSFRSKWWIDPWGKTFRELSFESRFDLPFYTIPEEIIISRKPYPKKDPIVFFGHYCMKNGSNIIEPNICCLDSCVSRKGKLTAYRWNGEKRLNPGNLVK
ncbi:metallophosphoesterase [Gaoshiqia sp. Z1-71]|uniref:metallophosphoesterase n=1 Tax=Gaoshiqia hydrogeniformans TaxID=3290090 RepID=UPI003BF90C42